jgi:hypothetical protein
MKTHDPQDQGWWMASDGNWYPPELHPSAEVEAPAPQPVPELPATRMTEPVPSVAAGLQGGQSQGMQFPDLFEKALQGSHLADNISVKGEDPESFAAGVPAYARPMATAAASPAAPVGADPGKKRWRRG